MSTLEKYLRMPLSLFEIGDTLIALPSPRKRFFNSIVLASGLSPNTVKMMLCATEAGIYPSAEVQKRIARRLNKRVEILFPDDRGLSGSLVELYRRLSAKRVELHLFIQLLSNATRASPTTVRKWLKLRNVPRKAAREDIAKVIGMSTVKLFPQ